MISKERRKFIKARQGYEAAITEGVIVMNLWCSRHPGFTKKQFKARLRAFVEELLNTAEELL